jgi:Rieske Fe-S protein
LHGREAGRWFTLKAEGERKRSEKENDRMEKHRRACTCGGMDRRSFLRDVTGLAAGMLVALGATARDAQAARVDEARGEQAGDTLRYPIPASDGVTIDHDNDVIIARYQNRIYAFSLACPHQNTALHWLGDQGRFQCPRHHSKYQPDGEFISGRATRNMDRFAVSNSGNQLVVDVNRLYRSDEQPAQWQSAFATP